MRRRELAIVLGVLVPFGVLLVLALLVSGEPAPAVGAEPPRLTPLPGREPTGTTAPVSAPPPVRALAPHLDAGAAGASPIPKALAAPLAAVTPEVMLCFRDQKAHQRDVWRLEVRFTPTVDGGFVGVRVPSTGNPWVAACIEDVFDELRFVPTGAETFQPATHTFVFDPAAPETP